MCACPCACVHCVCVRVACVCVCVLMIDPGSVVGHMLKQAEQNTFEKKNSVSHGNWSFYMVIIKT